MVLYHVSHRVLFFQGSSYCCMKIWSVTYIAILNFLGFMNHSLPIHALVDGHSGCLWLPANSLTYSYGDCVRISFDYSLRILGYMIYSYAASNARWLLRMASPVYTPINRAWELIFPHNPYHCFCERFSICWLFAL